MSLRNDLSSVRMFTSSCDDRYIKLTGRSLWLDGREA